jgi:NAD(P)-dependent dehydrogenase (short-subunit alcohol dehydrogenase family)
VSVEQWHPAQANKAGMAARLAGEVALVTGSTSGLGREIASVFAAEGARVTVTGRDRDRGADVVARITATGGEAAFVAADLREDGACEALVRATVERHGRLTVLVNNAVASVDARDAPVAAVSAADWELIVRVNLTAVALLCRAAIPEMVKAGRGAIVNISSRAAERGTPGLAAYTASKGGMNALTRSIAVDYAKDDIRCNTVSPGYVLHERRDADLGEERRQRLEGMHLTRLGTARDVALAALYLASTESAFVTGINLPVDGGSTAARGLVLG